MPVKKEREYRTLVTPLTAQVASDKRINTECYVEGYRKKEPLCKRQQKNAKIYLQELLRESLQAEQAQNLRHSETLQEQAERVQQQQSQRISTTL